MQSALPAKIGPAWVVIDALRVQEILGSRSWVPIPHATADVPGVMEWRGRALAVLDLFHFAESGEALKVGTQRGRTLVVEARSCTLAVPVDLVHEVQSVNTAALRPSHSTRMRFSSFEVDVLGKPAAVLDLDALVDALLAAGGAGDAG